MCGTTVADQVKGIRGRRARAMSTCLAVFVAASALVVGCGDKGHNGPEPDTTPPAKVADLAVQAVTDTSATLRWTAPGDDGAAGTASGYDIRWSASTITQANWDGAMRVADVPAPRAAGSVERHTVVGLSPGTTYYFGLKAADDEGNWSPPSNVASQTTSGGGSTEEPILAVSPTQLAFETNQTEKVLTITNAGTGTLTWAITDDQPWLTVSPATGSTTTEADPITVRVNRAGLGSGEHSGAIRVTPALGEAQQVTVRLTVTESPYSTPDSTLVIPPETEGVIRHYAQDGTVTLDASSDYAQSVEVGDIVVGQDDRAAPNGFLRKVTAKRVQGSSVVLSTESARMTEAFESMEISESHPLRPSDVRSSWFRKGCVPQHGTNDDAFSVDLDCVLYDADGDYDTENDQIKLVGSYDFTAELFAEIQIRWFTLRKLECGIETETRTDLGLIASFEWEFAEEFEFDLAEFHLAAIPLGGVVFLVPTLTIEAHVHGDLTVTFETGVRYTEVVTNGFGYADGEYYEIKDNSKQFAFTPPHFQVEFDFETGASLNASCLLYGVAGPYIGGKTGFHFRSILDADPRRLELNFDLEAILYAVVGIECDLLGLDWHRAHQLYVHPIGHWVIPLEQPPSLVLSAQFLDFGGGQTSLPFTITNGGGGTLTWSIADDRVWLSANPTSGSTTTEADPISVSVNRSGLSAGSYSGTVTVTPGVGSPQQVTVQMTVVGPAGDFILVQPGTFTMGSPPSEPGRDSDETQHQVTLTKGFYVGKHEVTQNEWQSVMGWNASSFQGGNRPVESITWFDAVKYCNERSTRDGYTAAYAIANPVYDGNHITGAMVTWNQSANGYRLLTEAEWEYACRATSQAAFCNGGITELACGNETNLSQVGWYCGNSEYQTHDVGGKAANLWGIQDMHGNVWEWCWDWYGTYPGTAMDPVGPASGSYRVLRGGSWGSPALDCRSAHRYGYWPDIRRHNLLGLRLSRTAP